MHDSHNRLLSRTLRGLELQLPHSDRADPLACGVRDDDGNPFSSHDLCGAGRDLPYVTTSSSTIFVIKGRSDGLLSERLPA